jgi:Ca2+-binding RTX toxin-like protein
VWPQPAPYWLSCQISSLATKDTTMAQFGTNASQNETVIAESLYFALGGSDYIMGLAAGSGDEIYGGTGGDLLCGAQYNGDYTGNGTFGDPFVFVTFLANSGDDWLFGEEGNDMIFGGDGDDVISGGSDDDGGLTLLDANDRYYVGGLYGGDGNDKVYGDAGNDDLYGEAGNDSLWGGTENDRLRGGIGLDSLSGESGNDILEGGDSNDKLSGSTGNDRLLGGNDNDSLSGSTGGDSLYGEAGNDTLSGGANVDYMRGGGGVDRFAYAAASEGGDYIRDFDTNDFVVVKGSAFSGLAAGALSGSRYNINGTGNAVDSSDRFIYNTATHALHYDSNGSASGGTKAILATFSNDYVVTSADILIA